MTGGLVKMSLISYLDKQYEKKCKSIDVMVNPDSYKISKGVEHTKSERQGEKKPSENFSKYARETLSFSIVYDGTGVIPGTNENTVDAKVEELDELLYNYVDKILQPHFVQVKWGSLLFNGQIQSYNLNYTLFSPAGSPLRVKIDLVFVHEDKLPDNPAGVENGIEQLVLGKEGDSAASLCVAHYENPLLAPVIAKLNELNSIRKGVVGKILKFPNKFR